MKPAEPESGEGEVDDLAGYARWLRFNYEQGTMNLEQIGRNLMVVGFGKDIPPAGHPDLATHADEENSQ